MGEGYCCLPFQSHASPNTRTPEPQPDRFLHWRKFQEPQTIKMLEGGRILQFCIPTSLIERVQIIIIISLPSFETMARDLEASLTQNVSSQEHSQGRTSFFPSVIFSYLFLMSVTMIVIWPKERRHQYAIDGSTVEQKNPCYSFLNHGLAPEITQRPGFYVWHVSYF